MSPSRQKPKRRPPYIGAVYAAGRSRTGRKWEVVAQIGECTWRLYPLGDDVRESMKMLAQTGNQLHGGPRQINRTTEELREHWEHVGAIGVAV